MNAAQSKLGLSPISATNLLPLRRWSAGLQQGGARLQRWWRGLVCRVGQAAAVGVLLEGSAKTAVRNKRGLTPLGEALVAAHVPAAQALTAGGADAGAPLPARDFRLQSCRCAW